jgi:preprotein translocase subunit SecE
VARDRKRAKQRRERRGTTAGGRVERPSAGNQPVHADLPAALEHTGEVDEFDAALVRGAGGAPASAPAEDAPNGELTDEDLASEDLLQTPALAAGDAGDGGPPSRTAVGGGEEARPSGSPLRGGNRAIAFLRASWAELQRVQWPDRPQVFAATAVVLGFVAIAGAYLGLADYVAKEIVEFIL